VDALIIRMRKRKDGIFHEFDDVCPTKVVAVFPN
jgi:hypothetical protein